MARRLRAAGVEYYTSQPVALVDVTAIIKPYFLHLERNIKSSHPSSSSRKLPHQRISKISLSSCLIVALSVAAYQRKLPCPCILLETLSDTYLL